jgi:hypothetical protein
VPIPDSCTAANCILFDHLVGARKQCRRHRNADCSRRFVVEDKIKFYRRLHGQIAGLLSAQNAIHIRGGTAKLLDLIGAVKYQPSGSRIAGKRVDTRQAEPRRERDDELAMGGGRWAGKNEKTTRRPRRKALNPTRYRDCVSVPNRGQCQIERRCRRNDRLPLSLALLTRLEVGDPAQPELEPLGQDISGSCSMNSPVTSGALSNRRCPAP